MLPKWDSLAYEWSPEAMRQFHEGVAEGTNSFLDENGQLAGESPRAGIYGFLLMIWPDIKAMLESTPRKTLTDLHKWMEPFMRVGVVNLVDLDYLRDVCAPIAQSGIGLQLRPLSSGCAKPSA